MKIANADKLKKHFENVVDVKLFTPAQIITIIDTFSCQVSDGKRIVFTQKDDNDILIHDLDAKDFIIGAKFTRKDLESWLYEIAMNNFGTEFEKSCIEIISRLDGFERFVEDKRLEEAAGGTEP